MKIIANAPMWFLLLGLTACGELDELGSKGV